MRTEKLIYKRIFELFDLGEAMFKNIIRLIRPEHWVKNGFVLLPLFFDGRFLELTSLQSAIVAFGAFCMAASAIYCLNDIIDIKSDRRHPVKCKRPIAAGYVPVMVAWILAISLSSASLLLCLLIPKNQETLMCVIGSYLILNVAYSLRLKQVSIVDVFCLSLGFVLRVIAGGVATGTYLSHWIILMTFLLALFLAFAKRRDDVVIYEATGEKMRKNVTQYNAHFINQVIGLIAGITMVAYVMYTVSPDVTRRLGTDYLYVTSVFVLAGLIRYLQIAIVDQRSGSPTKILLKDRFIQLCIVGWVMCFVTIIYLSKS